MKLHNCCCRANVAQTVACGTPLGNCTCGSRLMELLQISLRISFGASMCRTCKSHAASELFSHRSSSHAVSVPLWQRLTPLCSACETSNGCKKQVCFRHSGGMMWRLLGTVGVSVVYARTGPEHHAPHRQSKRKCRVNTYLVLFTPRVPTN